MRKRATDGTKISTSLTITKKTVRTRRRADRLLSSTISLASTQSRQKPDDVSGTRGEQGWSIVACRRSLTCFAARWVRHDQIGQCADPELLRDRQRPRKDQITGPGAEDRGAEYTPIGASDDLDHALGLTLGLRPVVLDKPPTKHARSLPDGARSGFGQPDLSELGIGIGDPGQCPIVDFSGNPKQGVPDHGPVVIEGDMRKLWPAGDIADGKDAAVCGAQPRVDGDTFRGRNDAGGGQIERLDGRPPPGGDQ